MRILGIELGAWSVKAVEMESRFRRADILDLHEIRLPLGPGNPHEIYKKAIEQLMSRLPTPPEKIVTSLPPVQTAFRFLQLPMKQRKKVEQMYRFEVEDSIPFKVEDAILEHYVTRMGEKSLVFCAVAPKKHIQSYLEWLKGIGLDPDWLTFEGMGLINLYLSLHGSQSKTPPPGPVLLIDMGHYKTNLAVVQNNRLLLFRSLPWGGFSITQSLAMGMNVSLEEAERLKINSLRLDIPADKLSNEAQDVAVYSGQALTSFLSDIAHSLMAFRSTYREEIQSVWIAGGLASTQGIAKFLEQQLSKPVSLFNPIEEMELKFEIGKGESLRFGEAIGRAFVFARKASLLFNFRKQELAKTTSLNEVGTFLKDPSVVRLAKYAVGLAAILLVYVLIATPLAQRESQAAQDELKKVFQETFRNVPPKLKTGLLSEPKDLKKFIDQKNNELDQKLKILSKNRVPMLGLMKAVSKAFPSDVRVDVNAFQVDDRNLLLDGVLYQGDLQRVTDNLKKITSFNNVTVQTEGKRFTYRGEVVGR